MRLFLFALLVSVIGLAVFLTDGMMGRARGDIAFSDYRGAVAVPIDIVNRLTSGAFCAHAAECSRGTPIMRVDVLNCNRVVGSDPNPIAAGQKRTFHVRNECGGWPRFRIYVEYFGLRPACTISASYNPSFLYTSIQVWGPYKRLWTDERGVFECGRRNVEREPETLVRNGRVDFYNGGSLPIWFGYRPNGCNESAGLAGLSPVGRGLAAGEKAGGYYSLYNHECGKYSRFWFEYGGDSSWCPPRELSGNHEFVRYGFYLPGWCQVNVRGF